MPKGLEIPKKFRTEITDKEGNLIGWHIIDYDTWRREIINELSEEQVKCLHGGFGTIPYLLKELHKDGI